MTQATFNDGESLANVRTNVINANANDAETRLLEKEQMLIDPSGTLTNAFTTLADAVAHNKTAGGGNAYRITGPGAGSATIDEDITLFGCFCDDDADVITLDGTTQAIKVVMLNLKCKRVLKTGTFNIQLIPRNVEIKDTGNIPFLSTNTNGSTTVDYQSLRIESLDDTVPAIQTSSRFDGYALDVKRNGDTGSTSDVIEFTGDTFFRCQSNLICNGPVNLESRGVGMTFLADEVTMNVPGAEDQFKTDGFGGTLSIAGGQITAPGQEVFSHQSGTIFYANISTPFGTGRTNGTDVTHYFIGSFPIEFGNNSISGTTADRWLAPSAPPNWGTATTVINEALADYDINIYSMSVIHGNPSGNGNDVVYTLQVEGTDSALSVTIPSTTETASSAILSTPISISRGQKYSVKVTKALSIGSSPNYNQCTLTAKERIV